MDPKRFKKERHEFVKNIPMRKILRGITDTRHVTLNGQSVCFLRSVNCESVFDQKILK
jgi:hypothetical protein